MANDSEVTLWEDRKTPRLRSRTVSLGPLGSRTQGFSGWWSRTTTFLFTVQDQTNPTFSLFFD